MVDRNRCSSAFVRGLYSRRTRQDRQTNEATRNTPVSICYGRFPASGLVRPRRWWPTSIERIGLRVISKLEATLGWCPAKIRQAIGIAWGIVRVKDLPRCVCC